MSDPWWRCDDCGKFRRMEEMERGVNPSMDFGGHVDLNEYQVCRFPYGCQAPTEPSGYERELIAWGGNL